MHLQNFHWDLKQSVLRGGCIFFFIIGFISFLIWHVHFDLGPMGLYTQGPHDALVGGLTICAKKTDRINLAHCLRTQFATLVPRFGLRHLMIALEDIQKYKPADDISRTRCHDITHLLGESGVKTSGNLSTTFMECTGLCQAGCYHGAVNGWMAKGHAYADIDSRLCSQAGATEDVQYSCYHGFGHAIADVTGYNLTRALSFCDKVPVFGRPPCGAGVFMEIFEQDPFSGRPISQPPNNIPQWCAALHAPYDEVCYSFAGIYTYAKFHNFDTAVAVCQKEPTEHRRGCIQDLGKSQFFTYPYDPALIQEAQVFCQKYASDWYASCMAAMVYVSPK